MKIAIINGPNLNLLGLRETATYGHVPFEIYIENLREQFPRVQIDVFQSNVEGELINILHNTGFQYQGIIINAGAYTHTSIALGDAIAAIPAPVVEVHISNVYAREDFRHKSFLSKHCVGIISGFGLDSYTLALVHLISKYSG
jgi:3-dehydroquinate dehydratase-2